MGRRKKDQKAAEKEEVPDVRWDKPDDDSDCDSSSSPPRGPRQHHVIDPTIRMLCHTYKIDEVLTQKLNDVMIEDRQKTWQQDIEKLYEVLKCAHSPAAMLSAKVRDLEKGCFVGKARCGQAVRDLARKHRLDRGAAMKLEDAMSVRESHGKDVTKDLAMLDEHLAASNKPSALISMKLESLRKGYNIGHCIYSREMIAGAQGPGVDGVFDKRAKRPPGFSDADLQRRFAEQEASFGGGQLMDEAAARKMVQKERKERDAARRATEKAKRRSRSCSRPVCRASPTPLRDAGPRRGSPAALRHKSRSVSCRKSPTPRRKRGKSVKRKTKSATPSRSRGQSSGRQNSRDRCERRKAARSRSRSANRNANEKKDFPKLDDRNEKKEKRGRSRRRSRSGSNGRQRSRHDDEPLPYASAEKRFEGRQKQYY